MRPKVTEQGEMIAIEPIDVNELLFGFAGGDGARFRDTEAFMALGRATVQWGTDGDTWPADAVVEIEQTDSNLAALYYALTDNSKERDLGKIVLPGSVTEARKRRELEIAMGALEVLGGVCEGSIVLRGIAQAELAKRLPVTVPPDAFYL